MATNDREFVCIATSVYMKIDASLITQNGCHVCLFSSATLFVFSGDRCVTMQMTSPTHNCPLCSKGLYLENAIAIESEARDPNSGNVIHVKFEKYQCRRF